MEQPIDQSLKAWIKSLPSSRPVFPESFFDRCKYVFWRAYTPYNSFFRDATLWLGIMKHSGRQDFLLGKIAPGQTIQKFVSSLVNQGFANHFFAWEDDGQIVNLRYVKDFAYQYHIRLFDDGEVRGHYEYTPECHPIQHLKEVGMEARRGDFLKFLGNRVTLA